jgi:hypothetical protein
MGFFCPAVPFLSIQLFAFEVFAGMQALSVVFFPANDSPQERTDFVLAGVVLE